LREVVRTANPLDDPGAVASVDGWLLNTAEARVMRLRGYGNAIVPPLAAEFVRAAMEVTDAAAPSTGSASAGIRPDSGVV